MVVKIGPLANWRLVTAGQSITMEGKKRPVKLALISAVRAPVSVLDIQTGSITGLGYVEGMEEFHFAVEGDCEVFITSEEDTYFRTDDGAVTSVAFDNKPFVKMMERQDRNPELEMMLYMQEQNANRRAQQMVNSMTAQMERLERMNNENHSAATGGNSGALPAGTSADGDGGAAGVQPAGAGAGTGGAQQPAAGVNGDPKPEAVVNP